MCCFFGMAVILDPPASTPLRVAVLTYGRSIQPHVLGPLPIPASLSGGHLVTDDPGGETRVPIHPRLAD